MPNKVSGKTEAKAAKAVGQQQEDCGGFHRDLFETLRQADKDIYELVWREYDRQKKTLQLVAAENQCSRACLAALGTVLQNKTAEGFVGNRLHGGCKVVDDIEKTAIERAKQVFAPLRQCPAALGDTGKPDCAFSRFAKGR